MSRRAERVSSKCVVWKGLYKEMGVLMRMVKKNTWAFYECRYIRFCTACFSSRHESRCFWSAFLCRWMVCTFPYFSQTATGTNGRVHFQLPSYSALISCVGHKQYSAGHIDNHQLCCLRGALHTYFQSSCFYLYPRLLLHHIRLSLLAHIYSKVQKVGYDTDTAAVNSFNAFQL